MAITRRAFTAGALSAALSARLAAPAFAQGSPALAGAIAAIRAHGEDHLRQFDLPGLTLGLTTPDGFSTVLDFGFANRDSRAPITPDTLFQIGSISKSMTAAVIHQLAAEGKLKLTDRAGALFPAVRLRRGHPSTLQQQHEKAPRQPHHPPRLAPGGR